VYHFECTLAYILLRFLFENMEQKLGPYLKFKAQLIYNHMKPNIGYTAKYLCMVFHVNRTNIWKIMKFLETQGLVFRKRGFSNNAYKTFFFKVTPEQTESQQTNQEQNPQNQQVQQ